MSAAQQRAARPASHVGLRARRRAGARALRGVVVLRRVRRARGGGPLRRDGVRARRVRQDRHARAAPAAVRVPGVRVLAARLVGVGESFSARALPAWVRVALLAGWTALFAWLAWFAYNDWIGFDLLDCALVGCAWSKRLPLVSELTSLPPVLPDAGGGRFPVLRAAGRAVRRSRGGPLPCIVLRLRGAGLRRGRLRRSRASAAGRGRGGGWRRANNCRGAQSAGVAQGHGAPRRTAASALLNRAVRAAAKHVAAHDVGQDPHRGGAGRADRGAHVPRSRDRGQPAAARGVPAPFVPRAAGGVLSHGERRATRG